MSFFSQIVDQLNAAVQTKDAAKVALASREAVRVAVKFLFEKKGVAWDEKATLLELIHSRTVEEFVAVPEQVAALDFVRMLGGSEVIDYIRANGEITVGILNTESPFNDYDLSDLFGNNLNEFKKLKDRINEMLPVAG